MNTVTADLLRTLPLPQHEQGDNKEGRGQIMVVGGCLAVPGAILLSAEGALRAGAGKLQIATCRSIAPQLGLAVPEAMVIGLPETAEGGIAGDAAKSISKQAAGAAAVLVGPGMTVDQNTAPLVAELLEATEEETAFVFDAGALGALQDCLEQLHRPRRAAVITPHAGEMAKLLGVSRDEVSADPLRYAQQAASQFRCTVVLKGGTTHVVQPDGEAWVFEGGTIGLATSGSGDVLAGVIAGLLARGAPAVQAAIWGVYLHAEAGNRLTRRYGGIGLLARELPGEIPAIMADTKQVDPE
jgi:ADP-dependent NAD(P)H-hydrate dehydratase